MVNPSVMMATIVISLALGNLSISEMPENGRAQALAVKTPVPFSLRADDASLPVRIPERVSRPDSEATASSSSQPRPDRPRPWLAVAEVAGINFGVWAILHYVTDAFYEYLSWETMRDNFRDMFEWDKSRYFVNFYHHPYHGYLYFNAGRANGLNFWGSSLCTLGGSLMWEMVMETYRPSINDLITTTTGGCVYGEMGYRFSALVRKKEARGIERIWREAVGTVLDPIGGLNRLFNSRDDGAPGNPGPAASLAGELFLAWPVVGRSATFTENNSVPLFSFTLNYGDPDGSEWRGEPFDMFTVRGRLRCGPDRPHLSLSVGGTLAGKALTSRDGSSHFLGVQQYYEYYGIDTLRVGGSSFTGGLTSRFMISSKVRLNTSVRLGWLVLGGTEDFAAVQGERRIYNLGTGWAASAAAAVETGGFEVLSASWRHYGLFVLQGQTGKENWDVFQGQVSFPVWRKLGVGLQCEYCGRRMDFGDLPTGHRRLFEARAFLSCQF